MPTTSVIKSPDAKLLEGNKLQSIGNNYSRFINQIKSEKKLGKKAGESRQAGATAQNFGGKTAATSIVNSHGTSQIAQSQPMHSSAVY